MDSELRRRIEAGMDAPSAAGGLPALVRRILMLLGRPRARYQQSIDRALLEEVGRIDWERREAQRAADGRLEMGLDELRQWMHNLQREHEQLPRSLAELSERVATPSPLHGDGTIALETFDAGLGGSVVGFRADTGEDARGRVYVGFEEYFRGSEAAIRERQRAYLPLLEGRDSLLDVGCGRGELLELMADMGVPARGIDLDPGMVEHCQAKGLAVELADAVPFLDAQGERSLDVVVAFQVIEHLPYAALIGFLRGVHRALGPGGRLVMETVNPHAPQALKHFWIDPTHQHPLFPEIVVGLCALTGFATAYIWYPQGTGNPDRDRGRQGDYAVVAEVAGPST